MDFFPFLFFAIKINFIKTLHFFVSENYDLKFESLTHLIILSWFFIFTSMAFQHRSKNHFSIQLFSPAGTMSSSSNAIDALLKYMSTISFGIENQKLKNIHSANHRTSAGIGVNSPANQIFYAKIFGIS